MKSLQDQDLRRAIKALLERFELYKCLIIEDVSSNTPISRECLERVEEADIIILILEKELRPGVVEEYEHARSLGKHVFPFYRSAGAEPDLEDFVTEEVRSTNGRYAATCPSFERYDQLIDMIETALLEHLTSSYRAFLKKQAIDTRDGIVQTRQVPLGRRTQPGQVGGDSC